MHAILFKLNFPIPRFLNNADEAVPACADQAMGAGMDELLQYYERELGTLHAHNQAFARRYPAIAGALGIVGSDLGTTDDPHLARMRWASKAAITTGAITGASLRRAARTSGFRRRNMRRIPSSRASRPARAPFPPS